MEFMDVKIYFVFKRLMWKIYFLTEEVLKGDYLENYVDGICKCIYMEDKVYVYF